MTATTESKLRWVEQLLRSATGEPCPDYEVVYAYGVGYADGYSHIPADQVWVTGNWNERQNWRDRQAGLPPTADDLMPQVLGDALERLGVEIEWHDEWDECQECHRLIRTQPDSYSWTAQYAWLEDVGNVCHDCLATVYGEDALTDFINDPRMAVTFFSADQLETLGFVKWAPGDEQDYAAGWYPGQTDDPTKILDTIQTLHPDSETVFFIDGKGQFDVHFSAYVRGLDEPDNDYCGDGVVLGRGQLEEG